MFLARYENYLKDEQKLSWKTVRDYICYLKWLADSIGDLLKPREYLEINDAILKISKERGYGPSTRKKFGTCIVRFYRWTMRESLIDNGRNPYPFHDFKGEKPKEPGFFSEEDVMGVLFHPRYSLQDLSEINLIWDTGIRAGELRKLKNRDLNLNQRIIHIREENSKNGKSRYVPFSPRTKFILKVYLWFLFVHYDGDVLFPSKHWAEQPEGALSKKFKRLGEYESPKRGYVKMNPHKFRHSLPIRMLDNEAPLTFVQNCMGHSTLNQTAQYTHYTIKNLKRSYDKYTNRSRKAAG